MAWDREKNHNPITLAKLKFAAREVVYEELAEYAEYCKTEIISPDYNSDKELERMLFDRQESLIDLGLARYGCCPEVVSELYLRTQDAPGMDPDYKAGIRMGILSGPIPTHIIGAQGTSDLNNERELALDAPIDEVKALLSNPMAGGLIKNMLFKAAPWNEVPDERYCQALMCTAGNPCFNTDNGNEHGPDFLYWDLQKGVESLVKLAPTTPAYLQAIYWVLLSIEPAHVQTLKEGSDEIIQRWSAVKVPGMFSKKSEDREGYSTEGTFVDEFLTLLAAQFGKTFDGKKSNVIGSMASDNRVHRCAFYGNGKLTPEQMQAGFAKDSDHFLFSVMFNDSVFYDKRCRAELESMIRGDLRYMYARRCKALAVRSTHFDAAPVSEQGADLLDDITEQTVSPTEKAIAVLATQITAMHEKTKALASTVWLAAAAVVFAEPCPTRYGPERFAYFHPEMSLKG